MTIKLLPQLAREFPAGLKLHQQPYKIVTRKQADEPDQMWVKHLSQLYDVLTEQDSAKELMQSDSEDEDYDYDYDDWGGAGDGGGGGAGRTTRGLAKSKARPRAKPASFPAAKGKARAKGRSRSREGASMSGSEQETEDEDNGRVRRVGGLMGALGDMVDNVAAGMDALTHGGQSTQGGEDPESETPR